MMSSESNLDKNTAVIHQLLAELQTQLSILEQQNHLARSTIRSEITPVEMILEDEFSADESTLLTDWVE